MDHLWVFTTKAPLGESRRIQAIQGCTGVAKAMDGRERPLCMDAPVSRRPWTVESDHLWPPFFFLTFIQTAVNLNCNRGETKSGSADLLKRTNTGVNSKAIHVNRIVNHG